ncbi:MAG: hypothetical protein ACPH06_04670 [Flavobacteriaceae bacterium]
MKQILITLLFFFTGFTVLAQVGIGTQTPQATLDITGNQGLLIPRMTDHTVLTPIDGTLDANEKGLQVYNTTTNTIMVWDGVSWNGMTPSMLNLTDTDLTTTPPVIGDLLMYDGVNWIPMPDQQIAGDNVEVLAGGIFKGKPIYKMAKLWDVNGWSSPAYTSTDLTPVGATEIIDFDAYLTFFGNTYDIKIRPLTNGRYFSYTGVLNSRTKLWYTPANTNDGWAAWKTGMVVIYYIK